MVEAHTVVHGQPFPDAPVVLNIELGVPVENVVDEVSAVLVISVVVTEQGVGEAVARIERIVDVDAEIITARVGGASRL
jgi:hypothetical protein